MQTRKFDELISYFNRKVSSMDIDQKYKMELLGMITAIGLAHEKEMPHWVSCSERLPRRKDHTDDMVLVCYGNGLVRFNTCMNGEWCQGNPIAWRPLPEPYRAERRTDE